MTARIPALLAKSREHDRRCLAILADIASPAPSTSSLPADGLNSAARVEARGNGDA